MRWTVSILRGLGLILRHTDSACLLHISSHTLIWKELQFHPKIDANQFFHYIFPCGRKDLCPKQTGEMIQDAFCGLEKFFLSFGNIFTSFWSSVMMLLCIFVCKHIYFSITVQWLEKVPELDAMIFLFFSSGDQLETLLLVICKNLILMVVAKNKRYHHLSRKSIKCLWHILFYTSSQEKIAIH